MADSAPYANMPSAREIVEEYRRTGGKLMHPLDFPVLLLTQTGAKSGQPRVNPVGYFLVDGRTFIVGSAGGRDNDPGWVVNVRAHPEVQVEIDDQPAAQATAVELPLAERNRVYPEIARLSPRYGNYEHQTDRVIPVFELRYH